MSNTSNSNAADRIVAQSNRRQRERAQVPTPRSASIIETAVNSLSDDESSKLEVTANSRLSALTNSSPEPQVGKLEADILPELDLEKGTTIRLQRTVFRETKLDGADKDYNRDTFFEAAWSILKDFPEIQQRVIHEAQRRSILRRKLGRNRAAKTMGENFSRNE